MRFLFQSPIIPPLNFIPSRLSNHHINSFHFCSDSNIHPTIHRSLISIFTIYPLSIPIPKQNKKIIHSLIIAACLVFPRFCSHFRIKYSFTHIFLNLAFSQVGYQYQGGQGQHTSEQPGSYQQLQQGKEREGQFTQGLGWEHFYTSNGTSS